MWLSLCAIIQFILNDMLQQKHSNQGLSGSCGIISQYIAGKKGSAHRYRERQLCFAPWPSRRVPADIPEDPTSQCPVPVSL